MCLHGIILCVYNPHVQHTSFQEWPHQYGTHYHSLQRTPSRFFSPSKLHVSSTEPDSLSHSSLKHLSTVETRRAKLGVSSTPSSGQMSELPYRSSLYHDIVSSTEDTTLHSKHLKQDRASPMETERSKLGISSKPHSSKKTVKTQTSQVDSTSSKDSTTSSGDISKTGSTKLD